MLSASVYAFNFVEIAANTYSEMREEALDRACLHNSYFEQLCQYLLKRKSERNEQ